MEIRLFVFVLLAIASGSAGRLLRPPFLATTITTCCRRGNIWGTPTCDASSKSTGKLLSSPEDAWSQLRGGASDSDDEEEESEDEDSTSDYDSDSTATEDDEYYGDEDDEEEENTSEGLGVGTSIAEYDEPLEVSPVTQIYVTIGVVMLCRKLDLFNPIVVMVARFLFIAYILLQQLFVLYVRFRAKKQNDRTPVTLTNPLSSILQSKLATGANDAGGGMVKDLASSFLSSESSVLEYDLKQARSLQGGILFNLIFMGFLHFKLEQTQTMLIQIATGFLNLFYNPLFQIYVLGRNLERPFRTATQKKMEQAAASDSTIDDGTEAIEEAGDEVLQETDQSDEEEEESDEEDENAVPDESDSDEDDTDEGNEEDQEEDNEVEEAVEEQEDAEEEQQEETALDDADEKGGEVNDENDDVSDGDDGE